MSSKVHPLTFSNFFSNHIINPSDKKLSSRDRKVAMAVSVILGFFTIGLIQGIVFTARLLLCGRVKKIQTPKPQGNKENTPDLPSNQTSTNDPKKKIDSFVVPNITFKRKLVRVESTKFTQQTLLKNIRDKKENNTHLEIQVADLTQEAFEILKEAKHIISIKLCFGENILALPEHVKLSELVHISTLEIYMESLEPNLAKQIASMDNLQHLSLDLLSQGKNSSASFKQLRNLKNLESIHFRIMEHYWGSDEKGNKVAINPLIFTNVFSIKGLKKISIGRINNLSNMFLRSLGSAKTLEELHMHSCIDADKDAIQRLGIAGYNNLKVVHLGLKQVDQDVYDAVNELKTRANKPVDIKVSHSFSPRQKKGRNRSFSE